MILLSIVIPSFNQGRFIEETLRSIIIQKNPQVEILVIDGGSTDNTLDIIHKYENDIYYWQSQKDKGQSDAINQGISKARGEFVTWLNSDDVFLGGAISNILDAIKENPSTDWFLGNLVWMNKQGELIKVGKVEKENRFWNKRYLFSNGGPSAIMRKSTLLSLGGVRDDFHYMMDTELWFRYLSQGINFKRINAYLWGLRLHEDAKMSGHNFANSKLADKSHPSWIQKRKENSFLRNNYPRPAYLQYLWRLSKIFSYSLIGRLRDNRLLGKHYSTLSF